MALRREVLRLWLTAMLRLTRLTVADEIENGLAYFRITFLEQLPRLYADLEATLATRHSALRTSRALAPFLRVGTWIGGDRDGNPNVNAGVLEHALNAQARLAFEHYLDRSAPAQHRAVAGRAALRTCRPSCSNSRPPRATPRRTAATSRTGRR